VPRTDVLLADPRLAEAAHRLGPTLVKGVVSAVQDQVRRGELGPQDAADAAVAALPARATSLRPVLNATGVVLHTNLGRAPLSPAAREAVAAAAGYVDVEFDLATGRRARRGRGTVSALLAACPDAQAALVVNNGAAALLLAVTALAAGGEVLVSRGELVEIGDGFRLPDLMTSAGAQVREVGTTNRTTLRDYADAVGPQTRAVVKIHPSNFRIEGFTSAVGVAELAGLPVPVIADLGSGLLAPDPLLPDEPDVRSALRAGAAVVTGSGDKLLGGPQAGLLLGRAEVVERLRRHPMARALRVDKLTLAALEATLSGPESPVALALRADPDRLRHRCDALADALRGARLVADVVTSEGTVGGGGAPGQGLAGWAVAVDPAYAAPLRLGDPAVVSRIERGRCLLDLRCVPPADDAAVAAAVRTAAGRPRPGG